MAIGLPYYDFDDVESYPPEPDLPEPYPPEPCPPEPDLPEPEVTKMDDVTLKELLFSLSWSAWSCYHNRNATEILQKHFPNVDAKALVRNFCAVIDSPPGEGSPK